MDDINITKIISEQVITDPKLWVGIIGGAMGAGLALFSNIIFHWFKEKPQQEFDNQRIKILKEMLNDSRFEKKWRNISTLSAVIGASDEETKRLLIKAKARGSEKHDGKWGLIKNHPFPSVE